jgi:hypothetical protein
MAKIFIPNPENKKYVNHKDGCKYNARLDDLEWVTPSENAQHAHNIMLNKSILNINEMLKILILFNSIILNNIKKTGNVLQSIYDDVEKNIINKRYLYERETYIDYDKIILKYEWIMIT